MENVDNTTTSNGLTAAAAADDDDAVDISDEDKKMTSAKGGGEVDNTTTSTSSSSRKRKAATKPIAMAEEEDDEFTAATKKILTRGLGGKEDVVSKIMSDVSDYIRLDDLAEIKSITGSTTTSGGVTLICSKLQQYYNTNDPEFVMIALETLWKDFFDTDTDDSTSWMGLSDHQRKQNSQEMYHSNGHHLVIDIMSYYPMNSKIQELGCRLLTSIRQSSDLEIDDRMSFKGFIVSERTMAVIAIATKKYMDKKKEQDNNINELAAAKVVGLSLMALGGLHHFLWGTEFEEPYFQNMESLGIYPVAFEALQHYPHDANCVFNGLRILQQSLGLDFRRYNLPADVLDRIVNEKTRNVFDQVIDNAVAAQLETDPEYTAVALQAQILRTMMTR